jgi:hypothetical protein
MLNPVQKPETAIPGSWDRQAGCYPDRSWGQYSFSIGIFEWVPAKHGGCKKGKTHQRVNGSAYKPEETLAKADRIVQEHNDQLAVARAKGQGDALGC